MAGAIIISPTDAASPEAVVGSAKRVTVASAPSQRGAAIEHCLEYLDSEYPDFKLEGSAPSVV